MPNKNTNLNQSHTDSESSDRGLRPLSSDSKDLVDSMKDYVSGDSTRSSSSHKFHSKDKKN